MNNTQNQKIAQVTDKTLIVDQALNNYNEQVQIDVQTMLNGRPCTMNALVADVKKQIYTALRKAFRK